MPLLKPGQWAVSSADIDPQYLSLWTGLRSLIPWWNGIAGFDLIARTRGIPNASVDLPIMSPTTLGLALDCTSTTSTPSVGFSSFVYPPSDFTCITLVNRTADFAANGTLLYNPSTLNHFVLRDDSVNVIWRLRLGGTLRSLNFGVGETAFPLNTWVLAGLRHTSGSQDVFARQVGGTELASASSSWSGDYDGDAGLNIGSNDLSGQRIPAFHSMFYMWDRVLSDEDILQLSLDPFGLIRFAPIVSGISVTLYATGDGTITDVVNELDAASPLWSSIDDDPASFDDDDWINNAITPGTVQFLPLLTDMPAEFDTADSASIVIRYRGQNFSTESLTLYVRLYQSDESTVLSDEVAVVTVSANSSFDNTAPVTITGVVAGSKAIWDGARLRLRWA